MRKVCLTEKQRKEAAEQAAIEKMYRLISDGLAILKNRERLNQQQLSERIGINPKSLSKLLHMDKLQIEVRTLLKIVYMLGLEIKPRNQA